MITRYLALELLSKGLSVEEVTKFIKVVEGYEDKVLFDQHEYGLLSKVFLDSYLVNKEYSYDKLDQAIQFVLDSNFTQ